MIKIEEGKSYIDSYGRVFYNSRPSGDGAYPWLLDNEKGGCDMFANNGIHACDNTRDLIVFNKDEPLTDGEKHFAGMTVEKKHFPDHENLIVAQAMNILLVDLQARGERTFSRDDAAKFAKIMGVLRP
jgi:hypothetical protein